jgi:hypothetical protein
MEWLDKLQVPGLVLAGMVIYFQFKQIDQLVKLMSEQRTALAEVIAMLRQICSQKFTGDRE